MMYRLRIVFNFQWNELIAIDLIIIIGGYDDTNLT